jgi:hypothetical protein
MLAALAGACSGRQGEVETTPASRPSEATLKVVNRTGAAVQVHAGGRPLGEVPPGREQYFVGISPGAVDLRAASLDGALAFRRDLLTLEPGETFTWILREGATEAGAPRAAGALETASIVVENGTDWHVDVMLDGALLGSVPAGRSTRFDAVPAGAHRLEARATETSFPQEFPVLEPGETFTWRLRGPGPVAGRGLLPAPGTGRLRVENPNPESVSVLVNGVVLGRVEGRNTRIFDNLAADRVRLSAESADGLTRYEGPVLRIEAGGVALWRLGTGRRGAEVAGRAAGAPSTVAEPAPVGAPSAVVAPPAQRTGEPPSGAIPPPDAADVGEAPVREMPGDTGHPAEPVETGGPNAGAAAGTGEAAGELGPAAGTGEAVGKVFVVENHTGQDLEIFFDGLSAGTVGAGMAARFTDLPGLRFTPSAASASGARRFPHPEVDLSGRQSFSWIIEP